MISVIYADNDLLHDYIFNSTTKKWGPGTLADQKLVIHPNSGLSVLYNQCSYCSNTTIVVSEDLSHLPASIMEKSASDNTSENLGYPRK